MNQAPMDPKGRARGRGLLLVSGTVAVLLAATLAARVLNLDLSIASWFYDPASGFPLGREQPWKFLYEYGTIPGLALILASVLAWAGSFWLPRLASWRRLAALVALTSILGAGVLVNGVLKPYWGRPRPTEIVRFGGRWEFRGPLSPGVPGKGQSFPCGHCTMGFVFLPLAFAWKRSRKLAVAGVAFGAAWGGLLSVARMVQGAHFLTDCLWSGGVILVLAEVLYHGVPAPGPRDGDSPPPTARSRAAAWVLVAVAVVAALAFLTRRPVYEVFRAKLRARPGVTRLVVTLDRDFSSTRVAFEEGKGRVCVTAQGFGFPGRKVFADVDVRVEGDTLFHDWRAGSRGYFSELAWSLEAVLPPEMKDRVQVEFRRRDGP